MKSLLDNLGKVFAATSYSVRVTLGIAILAVLGAAGYSGFRASNPHYELLYGNLDANMASQMTNALAAAGVRFQLSQPPGPHALYVEVGSEYAAQNAIALSGATATAPTGIITSSAGSSVFDGSDARFQKSMKREWEEMENQLRLLTFVSSVRVTASIPDRSPFRRDKSQTVAVTLVLKGNAELSKRQAQTVAKLVRFRFDVPSENVIISDQFGNSVYDGGELAGPGSAMDVQESRTRFEQDLQAKANLILDKVLGEGAAYVVVNSEWSYDQRETVRESYNPDKVVEVSKDTESTKTPVGSGIVAAKPIGGNEAGGPVGSDANLAGQNPVVDTSAAPAVAGEATTKSERTKTIVGKETEHLLSRMPVLKRISLSLFLDESLKDRETDLMASVQAAVGFVEERDDAKAFVAAFASLPRDDEGNVVRPEPAPLPEEPSAIMGLLLKHGIEVIAALGFLFVLMKALKGGTPASSADAAAGAAGEGEEALNEVELERLAIAQVEELVRSEPERVAEILSAWALEDVEAEKVGS